MTDRKTFLRRVVDSVVEGRSRQAQRFVEQYLASHGLDPIKGGAGEVFTRR